MKRLTLLLLAFVLPCLTACGSKAEALTAGDAWVRFNGGNGAAYVTIENTTNNADALIGVSVPGEFAAMAHLHRTTTSENGMLGMDSTSSIDLPADFKLQMSPGTFHIMLMNPPSTPQPGSKVPITLQFRNHEPITVEAQVRS